MKLILKKCIFFMVIFASYGCDNGGEMTSNNRGSINEPKALEVKELITDEDQVDLTPEEIEARYIKYASEAKALEVREWIAAELQVGSTSEEIEAFFRKHEIEFEYKEVFNRYNGMIMHELYQNVVIQIGVDERKAFKTSEVEELEAYYRKYVNETKALEVREWIAAELQVGSTSEEIETFFRKYKIEFSHDKFFNRYQAVIRDVSDSQKIDQAVRIHIYVDERKAFKTSDVYDIFG